MPNIPSRTPAVSRRLALKGLGGVVIGLPFFEEMLATTVRGALPASVPTRAFNVFFGLGIPAPLQNEGFSDVLEPLKPLADKLLIMRNVDQIRCDESGINAHFDGASGAFTAEPPNGEARAGGPSIDQVIRRAAYPDGLPPGITPTLVAGTFFRRSRVSRYVHSYNPDGSVAATMQEKPRELFERVFGRPVIPEGVSEQDYRLKRSVLDSVVSQFRRLLGPHSPLGSASKSRLTDHLDRIREYERRAFQLDQAAEEGPELPPPSTIAHGGEADPGGEGIDMRLEDLVQEWRLLADLYAMAIKMDRTRFGAITFLAAGERLRVTGDYHYDGRLVYQFDDAAQLRASGSAGCSHEWWHKFNEDKENTQLRAHAHMKMREVAYFLGALDDADSLEGNGRTILENALFTVSTESGDGRHSNVKRELSGVFHAMTGANGKIKTGQIMDVGAEGIDVYNTVLEAMGAPQRLGPTSRDGRAIDAIRA